jgi:signal transduction histidine kinase
MRLRTRLLQPIRIITRIKISDRILVVVFLFSTCLVLLLKFFIATSLEELLIASYIVYSLAFAAAYILSRKFAHDLRALTLKIEEIAAGHFAGELQVKSGDEIGQLSNALNELISRLRTRVAIDVSKNKEINQAKTDFVALASHQLRTPLSIIKWYVDYVLSGDAGKLNEEQHKYISQVYLSNERLIELVNALLDVSRIDVGTFAIEPEPTNLIKVANEVVDKMAAEAAGKKIKMEKAFDELPVIDLDPRLMKIVFEHLLSNSFKYTPADGLIRLEIMKAGEHVLIKVADTGCGIPRAEQPKIFTKMFRAANVQQIESIGTGLGLYVVKAIIEQSGGRIWFESPSLELILEKEASTGRPPSGENKGTTFFISLPLKGMKKKHGTKKLASYR